jgi:peptidoglycan/xylan/chitin deacetylase (PgdA/CDA1 family)
MAQADIGQSKNVIAAPSSQPVQQRPFGGFVVSLDFELHWGVRDIAPLSEKEKQRLLTAREMVIGILELFAEHSIHATWATVGLLFASSRSEVEMFRPRLRAGYKNGSLDPYTERLGESEEEDPYHFAPSLIRRIADTQGQEIASHSFSHFYCLEDGQNAESFTADLESSIAIAGASGFPVRSYVFARNQVKQEYLPILAQHGIQTYRGGGSTEAYRAANFREQRKYHHRATRLADTYVNLHGMQSVEWPSEESPACLNASRYLAPSRSLLRAVDSLKVKRVCEQMKQAAIQRKIFHLWWHPEDFANGGDANLRVLKQILTEFCEVRAKHSMQSLSMLETCNCKSEMELPR